MAGIWNPAGPAIDNAGNLWVTFPMWNAIGFIKFPMPALEINSNGIKFHYLYM